MVGALLTNGFHMHFSSFALGKRWLRVYTVCMDLLNSPEVLSLKYGKRPPLSSSLCKANSVCYQILVEFLF